MTTGPNVHAVVKLMTINPNFIVKAYAARHTVCIYPKMRIYYMGKGHQMRVDNTTYVPFYKHGVDIILREKLTN